MESEEKRWWRGEEMTRTDMNVQRKIGTDAIDVALGSICRLDKIQIALELISGNSQSCLRH